MRRSVLAATSTAVAATAALGSLASSGAQSPWYRRLDKPAFQPPAVAFPVVWTALYADVAVASARVLSEERRPQVARATALALGGNLVLNAGWSWVFFRWRRLGLAPVVAAALTASGADLTRRARQVDGPAAAGFAAYTGWCAFATVLSTAIWRRNRSGGARRRR